MGDIRALVVQFPPCDVHSKFTYVRLCLPGNGPADDGESFMDTKISEAERQRRARQRAASIQQRAMTIGEFCQRYAVGRTTIYGEIKRGRLRALKVGKRTLITEDDAEDWLRRLPALETGSVS
jgi:excisionase family DNA binding protein